jgi:hypothetical protein
LIRVNTDPGIYYRWDQGKHRTLDIAKVEILKGKHRPIDILEVGSWQTQTPGNTREGIKVNTDQ